MARRSGTHRRRWVSIVFTLALVGAVLPVSLLPAAADGGDFSIDFAASAPLTYDHSTGGGAFDDRTVGKTEDIVESLEGGDFLCFDTVSYLAEITVDATPTDPVQTIQLDFEFTADTTGQSGAAIAAVEKVVVNYGSIYFTEGDAGSGNVGDGPGATDSGIIDDQGSAIQNISSGLTGPLFQMGSDLELSFQVTDLEAGEVVVVRIDVTLACDPGSRPTGNLQARLADANVVAPAPDAIPGGAQTIPFKQIGDLPIATLRVDKVTDPSGAPDLFDFTVDDVNDGLLEQFQLADQDPEEVFVIFPGEFAVSEDAPLPGDWVLVSASCTGDFDGDGNADAPIDPTLNNVVLGDGSDVTCTFNNALPPELKLVKNVTNDDGGDAVADDWTLSATADPPDDGLNFSNAGGSGVFQTVFPNVGYDLAETAVAGYTAGSWSCNGGSLVDSTVTLSAGDQVTCEITNDDQAPTLKLVKKVTNDDGGDAVADDWTLTATRSSGAGDASRDISTAGGSGVFETVFANAVYDLAETSVDGYTAGSWSCDGGTFLNDTVTLDEGETGVTCEITNDDQAPTLKLVKEVDNGANPGGTAVADDWTLTATRIAGTGDGSRNISTAGGSGVFETVFSNTTYQLAESGPTGYQIKTDWSCDGGTFDADNDTVILDEGETGVTCTIVNEALGMVTLYKLTNGVESAMVWNFTLQGPGVDESDSSPPTTVDFGGVKLIPGEEYTLCETGIPAGWTLEWQADTDGDGVPDTIIPMVANANDDPVGPDGYSRVYDPNFDPNNPFTNDTRCVNFVVDVGETLAFQIDNQFPGGEPRTIGYWKNWNTCSGGNQANTAAKNGGPAEGWFILDDLLNNPGYTIGVLLLDGDDCEQAVDLLDKRDIVSGNKKASDGAYNLASQLLAAQLNLSAGAETCQAAVDAVNDGQALLAGIGFDGTGNYLKGKQANEANALAEILDQYNNGNLCT